MKKTYISHFIVLTLFAALFMSVFLTGCDFNLGENKYLDRPDVTVDGNRFLITGSYISKTTTSITIYRQNVRDTGKPIERVAVLFPDGDEDKKNQTYKYFDERIIVNQEYRYYVRFTDKNGERNRTEWSDKKTARVGAASAALLTFNVNNNNYRFDETNMTLTLDTDTPLTFPDNTATIITDISNYMPALVFQNGDKIQTFVLPGQSPNNTKIISLRELLPQEFFNTDIVLLGIVGQKTEKNSSNVLKSVSWTNIAPIKVTTLEGRALSSIRLNIEFGQAGIDYSTTSDNEN